MQILLQDVGKKFENNWIFRKLSACFTEGSPTVILGNNGSGKSTLLQIVAGNISQSEGAVECRIGDRVIPQSEWYRHITIASPYLDLPDELSFEEIIQFQAGFKPFRKALTPGEVIEMSGLSGVASRPVKHFSSGMKQRVKLTLAVLADTGCLLLDEPCSNLDRNGFDWYQKLVTNHLDNRITLVCSNAQTHEYTFCQHTLNLSER